MSTFSCPHLGPAEACLRHQTDCVPGRKGCVLPPGAVFSLPVEERIRRRAEERRREN